MIYRIYVVLLALLSQTPMHASATISVTKSGHTLNTHSLNLGLFIQYRFGTDKFGIDKSGKIPAAFFDIPLTQEMSDFCNWLQPDLHAGNQIIRTLEEFQKLSIADQHTLRNDLLTFVPDLKDQPMSPVCLSWVHDKLYAANRGYGEPLHTIIMATLPFISASMRADAHIYCAQLIETLEPRHRKTYAAQIRTLIDRFGSLPSRQFQDVTKRFTWMSTPVKANTLFAFAHLHRSEMSDADSLELLKMAEDTISTDCQKICSLIDAIGKNRIDARSYLAFISHLSRAGVRERDLLESCSSNLLPIENGEGIADTLATLKRFGTELRGEVFYAVCDKLKTTLTGKEVPFETLAEHTLAAYDAWVLPDLPEDQLPEVKTFAASLCSASTHLEERAKALQIVGEIPRAFRPMTFALAGSVSGGGECQNVRAIGVLLMRGKRHFVEEILTQIKSNPADSRRWERIHHAARSECVTLDREEFLMDQAMGRTTPGYLHNALRLSRANTGLKELIPRIKTPSIPQFVNADAAWDRGHRGQGVRIITLDSSLNAGILTQEDISTTLSASFSSERESDTHAVPVLSVALSVAPEAEIAHTLIKDGFFKNHTEMKNQFVGRFREKKPTVLNFSQGISLSFYMLASVSRLCDGFAADDDFLITVSAGNSNEDLSNMYCSKGSIAVPKDELPHMLFVGSVGLRHEDVKHGKPGENPAVQDRFLTSLGAGLTLRVSDKTGQKLIAETEGEGTSFAAPTVAGAAAVIRSAFPTLPMTTVAEILLHSATRTFWNRGGVVCDSSESEYRTLASDRTHIEFDPAVYGRGLLSIKNAHIFAEIYMKAVRAPTAAASAAAAASDTKVDLHEVRRAMLAHLHAEEKSALETLGRFAGRGRTSATDDTQACMFVAGVDS